MAPTAFQRNSFPPPWRERITLIHEGVDCEQHQPDPEARLVLPNGLELTRQTPVITYVCRAFEPLRGLRSFLAALLALLATNPELQVVMVGGDGKGYGPVADHPSGHLGAAFDQLRGQLDLRACTGRAPCPTRSCVGCCNSAVPTFISPIPTPSPGACWKPWPVVHPQWGTTAARSMT